MAKPWGLPVRSILVFATLLPCLFPGTLLAESAVHTFDCKNCHIPSLSVEQLGGGNVCLSCHDKTLGVLLGDGTTGTTTSAFNNLDASNAMGYNPGAVAGKGQTSHNWGAPDAQPRAGATAPSRALYPQFYSRFGSSQGKVTCSRCHNPHADRTNPQLLIMGPGSAQQMCLACHTTWNQGPGMSNVTHPVNIDYAAAAAAHPGKYAAAPPEDDGNLVTNGQISLFGGKLLCGSCHQTHFSDSNATTADTPENFAVLSSGGGDGKLLRADGAGRADKSALCKTCHTYEAHGDASGEKVGCLVCHGGHSNDDPTRPNYYMLRKTRAVTATFGEITGLDYSDPAVLDPTQKAAYWNDRTDGTNNGYCERCHGDAKTIGAGAGQYHVAAAVCTNCHLHSQGGGAFTASCDGCHGMPPVSAGSGGPTGLAGTPGTTGSATAGAHALHVTTKEYPCDSCHANSVGSGPTHNDGAPQSVTIGFSLFNGAYLGGSYNGQAGVAYDSSQANTIVTSSGTKTCASTYCHGNYPGSGKNASPQWDNPGTAACGSCHGASNSAPPTTGFHGLHASSSAFNFSCTTCHKGIVTGSGSYTIADQVRHVDGKVDWAFDATDPRLRGGNERYNIASGTAPPSDGTTPRSYTTCENVYCHSNAQPDGGNGPPDRYASPNWTFVWTHVAWDCHSCHNGASHFLEGGATIASGSHTSHLAYPLSPANNSKGIWQCMVCHRYDTTLSGETNSCDNCHPPHNPVIQLPMKKALFDNHVDGKVTINFDPIIGAASSYNGTPQPGDGYSNCANTYCHSNGTSVASGTIPANTSATWGTTLTCSGCHGNPPGYTSGSPKANSHAAHGGSTCDKCHSATTTTGTTITGKINHVNQVYNVTAGNGVSFTYTYAATGGTCTSISCHSNGNAQWGGTVACGDCHENPPAYANGSPKANSHAAHGSFSCNKCHNATTTNGTTITNPAKHGNSAYDVIADGIASFTYTYASDGGNCASISCHFGGSAKWGSTLSCDDCHGNPPSTGAHLVHTDGTGAAYGSDGITSTLTAYSFNCGNCHPLAGSKHGNGVTEVELYDAAAAGFKQNTPAGADRTGTGSATVCRNVYCHSSGQDASVRQYVDTPSWGSTFTGNRCAGCHGDPPAYSNSGPGNASPNSHYASQVRWDRPVEGGHLVGLHFDNIKKLPPDGPGGLSPSGGGTGSGAGHGDPATSTTISCPTCHAGTVTVAGQFSAPGTTFSCQSCHVNPVAGSIANRANHVNGIRDVQFMTGTFRTRAQLKPAAASALWPDPEPEPGPFKSVIEPLGWTRNNGYKTATNSHDSVPFSGSYRASDKSCTTVCHLNQPIQWGDTGKGCSACHVDL